MTHTHWRDHRLCVCVPSRQRVGAFVAHVRTCVICGREEHEIVYRPPWWRRLFERDVPVRWRQETALFEAWGKR